MSLVNSLKNKKALSKQKYKYQHLHVPVVVRDRQGERVLHTQNGALIVHAVEKKTLLLDKLYHRIMISLTRKYHLNVLSVVINENIIKITFAEKSEIFSNPA